MREMSCPGNGWFNFGMGLLTTAILQLCYLNVQILRLQHECPNNVMRKSLASAKSFLDSPISDWIL